MIKVSVIIPVYNAEKYLEQCLDSVVGQTLRDIEIICIDDGSTDGSLKILERYAERITIIQNQENQGAGASRNAGIRVAQGEYLSILDADDFFDGDMLKKAYDNAKQFDSDVVLFKLQDFHHDTQMYGIVYGLNHTSLSDKVPFSKFDNPQLIFQITTPQAYIKLYRRKFITDNNITFSNTKICNDIKFNLCTLYMAERISYVDEVLVYYRRNNASISSSRGEHSRCVVDAHSEFLKECAVDPMFLRSYYNFVLGSFCAEYKSCYPLLRKSFLQECRNFFPITRLFSVPRYTAFPYLISQFIKFSFFYYGPSYYVALCQSMSHIRSRISRFSN